VKNRLASGNRDFLINFTFGDCKLLCEVQVGLRDNSDEKGSSQDHFNHFLYELSRSNFGPLSETTLIIANQVDIGSFFRQEIMPIKREYDRLVFHPQILNNEIKIDGYSKESPECKCLCNNCL
jgi:hypothetical protein